MPAPIPSFNETMSINTSGSGRHRPDDEHFRRCWHLSNCKDCLEKEDDCSWCPFTWTCVPNPNKIPFLAPAWDPDGLCPHWAERWELRTRPLGCQVSTITTLTSLVTIACTLFLTGVGFVIVLGVRRMKRLDAWRPRWWRFMAGGPDDGAAEASSLDGEEGRLGAGMDGLISRLRRQKVQDDTARQARLGHANGRETEPLLGASSGDTS